MPLTKIDRRICNTKALLRSTLIDLMQDKPVGRIRVKEICEKAGINRGTFYAHYKDVQDLQEQIFAEFLERVGDMIESADDAPGSPESVAHLARVLRFIYENRRLVLTLLGENSSISSQDAVQRFMLEKNEQLLLEKKMFGNFPVPEDLRAYLYSFTAAGCVSLLRQWLTDGAQSADVIAQLIVKLTAGGLSTFLES